MQNDKEKKNIDTSDKGSEVTESEAEKDLKVDKKVVKVDGEKKSVKKKLVMNVNRVLIRPIVTEKVSDIVSDGKYVFEVAIDTNKSEVTKTVNNVYGVKPTKVNIIKSKGKVVTRGRWSGKRKDWKKAIVTLPKGKTIEVHEGV